MHSPETFTPVQRGPGIVMWGAVRTDLEARIRNGYFAPGQQLPSESTLAQSYDVNRLTVRRALQELSRHGVIRTEHGVGSFVVQQPIRHRIDDGHISMVESMAARGQSITQLWLETIQHPDPLGDVESPAVDQRSAGVGLSDPAELWKFPDFPGAVTEFRYSLHYDGTPWCRSFAIVPTSLASTAPTPDRSIFADVADVHGLDLRRGERRFSAIPADPSDATLLNTAVGSPLLLLSGNNIDQQGRIVATIVHRIRGDRAEYALRLN